MSLRSQSLLVIVLALSASWTEDVRSQQYSLQDWMTVSSVGDYVWSPDGSAIYYTSNAAPSGTASIYRVAGGGGDPTLLSRVPEGRRPEPTEIALRRLGDGLGLDSDAVIGAMNSDEVTGVIADNRRLAQQLQINGTPTFVLHDEMLRGYLPADQMAAIVAEKRG